MDYWQWLGIILTSVFAESIYAILCTLGLMFAIAQLVDTWENTSGYWLELALYLLLVTGLVIADFFLITNIVFRSI